MPGGADLSEMRERWLARYGVSGSPVAAWKVSNEANAPALAFTALVKDSRLLHRVATQLAWLIARDARTFIAAIRHAGAAPKAPAMVLSSYILGLIERWEKDVTASAGRASSVVYVAPDSGDDPLATVCRRAMRLYPQFNESVGRIATTMLNALGTRGLDGVKPDWARMLAFESALYCARHLCGELKQPALPGEEIEAGLATVQAWAARSASDLMRVSYGTPGGSPALRAAILSRDSGLLARLASDLPGGAGAQGFALWEDAEEMHGFAAMALDGSVLRRLELSEAERLASSAIRYATQMRDEPGSVLAPDLAGHPAQDITPARVIAMARIAVPNGVRPRLTERRLLDASAAPTPLPPSTSSPAPPRPMIPPTLNRALGTSVIWEGVAPRR